MNNFTISAKKTLSRLGRAIGKESRAASDHDSGSLPQTRPKPEPRTYTMLGHGRPIRSRASSNDPIEYLDNEIGITKADIVRDRYAMAALLCLYGSITGYVQHQKDAQYVKDIKNVASQVHVRGAVCGFGERRTAYAAGEIIDDKIVDAIAVEVISNKCKLLTNGF